jgi:SAM-dependent methyltransferase
MHDGATAGAQGMFDQEVDAYERARPSYPEALFDDLIAYVSAGGLSGPFEVVEVGPGTGKATASLLARGMRVTAIEHGAEMSAFLRRKFEDDARLQVANARFEDAQLTEGAFDAVVSATAFHWIEPEVRLVKSHSLLRAGGAIAIIETNQISSEVDRGFFDRCLPIYQRYRPDERNHSLPVGEDLVPDIFGEIEASALFDDVRLYRYRWDQTYPTAAYADLVRSYRRTQQHPREEREALIADLCELIDAEFDGYVVRPLVMTLVAGRKAPLTS